MNQKILSVEDHEPKRAVPLGEGQPLKSRPASLLVVEDEEMNRFVLRRRLEREGYSITLAEDGAKALALLEQQTFDLVLLDVNMPGLNGLQVLSRLRETHSPDELPVILVTARSQSEHLAEAFGLGANDYVTKP